MFHLTQEGAKAAAVFLTRQWRTESGGGSGHWTQERESGQAQMRLKSGQCTERERERGRWAWSRGESGQWSGGRSVKERVRVGREMDGK